MVGLFQSRWCHKQQTKLFVWQGALSFLIFFAFFKIGQAVAQDLPSYPLRVPVHQSWSFSGPFGRYDKAQLQRGLKVYKEVCASCHSLNDIRFRDLKGLGYTEKQIEAFAAQFSVKDGPNAQGQSFMRKGQPNDFFIAPFANSTLAALANNGAVPPDLSNMARARAVNEGPAALLTDILTDYNTAGADYIVAFLTGYQDPPPNVTLPVGNFYNPYFIAGDMVAMPPALFDDMVSYSDGTVQTAQQYARDVAAFLTWCADPHMEARERLGFNVISFLLLFCLLLFLLKKQIFNHLNDEE